MVHSIKPAERLEAGTSDTQGVLTGGKWGGRQEVPMSPHLSTSLGCVVGDGLAGASGAHHQRLLPSE
jgi:hypothetical protein